MIGFISLKQRKVYLKNKEFAHSEEEFKNSNFLLDEYGDVKLWLTDSSSMTEFSNNRWLTNHCATPLIISEWDSFSMLNRLTPQQIIKALGDIPQFFPAVNEFTDNQKEIWKFDLPPFDCELPDSIKNSLSASKTLDINIDPLEFYLWLIQKDILIPKGSPSENKKKLKDILCDENQLHLTTFIKREQIERFFKKTIQINNKHWQGEWIAAAWLRIALFGEMERQLEREFDVLEYTETQPITNLFLNNFNLTWLFCPSAHYVLLRHFEYLNNNTKKEYVRVQLITYLIGAFITYKVKQANNNYLIADFSLLKWQVKQDKKLGMKEQLVGRYN